MTRLLNILCTFLVTQAFAAKFASAQKPRLVSVTSIEERARGTITYPGGEVSFRGIGCDRTGGTDCTLAVQSALYALENQGGGTLYGDPQDFYLINSNLTVPSQTTIDLRVSTTGMPASGVFGLNPNNAFGLGSGPGGTILLSPSASITLSAGAGLINGYVVNSALPTPTSATNAQTNINNFAGTALVPNASHVRLTNLAVIGFAKAVQALDTDGRLTIRDLYVDDTNDVEIGNSTDVDHIERVMQNAWYINKICSHFSDGCPLSLTVRNGTFLYLHDSSNAPQVIDAFTYGSTTGFNLSNVYLAAFVGGGAEMAARGNGYIPTSTSYGLKTSGRTSLSWTSGDLSGQTFPVHLLGTGSHSFVNMEYGADGSTTNFASIGPDTSGSDVGSIFSGGANACSVNIAANARSWTYSGAKFTGQITATPFCVDKTARAYFAAFGTMTLNGTQNDTFANRFVASTSAVLPTIGSFIGSISGESNAAALKIGNIYPGGTTKAGLDFVGPGENIVDSIEDYVFGNDGMIFRLSGSRRNIPRFQFRCGSSNASCEMQSFSGQTLNFGDDSHPMGKGYFKELTAVGALTIGDGLGIAAAGTTQSTATALTADVNEITYATSGSATGVLARAWNGAAGEISRQEVINVSGATINIWPPSGAAIWTLNSAASAGSVNTAATLATGSHATLECKSATLCYMGP